MELFQIKFPIINLLTIQDVPADESIRTLAAGTLSEPYYVHYAKLSETSFAL